MKSNLVGYEKCHFRDHGADYMDSKDMEPVTQKLYALQADVPRLPVPELAHTLELFLKSVKPHVTEEEFKETKRKVEELGKPGGFGEELQKRLVARKDANPNSSWFIKHWNNIAYLQYRDSIVWNVTYFLQFQDELEYAMKPTRRASRFVTHALEFRKQIVEGSLPPDMGKSKPWSNTQYKYMFNSSRMPGPNQTDFVRTYAPDLFNHIVVLRKNRIFTFDVISNGKQLSVDEIQAQLDRIVKIADSLGTDVNPVAILTAEDRDVWYNKRQYLVKELTDSQCKINEASFEKIDSAILGISLEDSSPTTRDEIAAALLTGNGRNRYWDKTVQFVFFENGKGGTNIEHALMDGTTTTRMINFCLERLFKDSAALAAGPAPANTAALLPEPELIQFALDARAKEHIREAEKTFDDIVATKEIKVLMFHGYGKNTIKKFKVSPDAFAQLAIQYAYYRTFGCVRGTYESTQTRTYLHGRTEVTRSVTEESLAFCKAMMSDSTDIKGLYEKLQAATQAHSAYTAKASAAMGCDRHFSGLKMVMKPGESVELFSDIGFARSCTWALSTSGLVGEHMDGWGFGEVVPHGLGIGYSVLDDRLRFTVSSRHKWAERMCANLEVALLHMQKICVEAQKTIPQSKL